MTNVRKFIAALVGAALSALSLGLLPDEWAPWVTVAIAFLTAAGVYAAPNEPKPLLPQRLTEPPYTPGDPAGGS